MKLKFWIKKNFGVLTKQECLDLGLEFGFNIYGDGINKLNCRSIWLDYWGKTFRCSELGERAIPKIEESQQTAVEFAVEKLEKLIPSGNQIAIYAILEQAKRLDKKQKEAEYWRGREDAELACLKIN